MLGHGAGGDLGHLGLRIATSVWHTCGVLPSKVVTMVLTHMLIEGHIPGQYMHIIFVYLGDGGYTQ